MEEESVSDPSGDHDLVNFFDVKSGVGLKVFGD
jgi:hypothetical protein